MKITPVTERFSVSAQPSKGEIAGLAERGTVLLINNRPDDEEPGQPGTHLPVTGAAITRVDVERFRRVVLSAPGPVVAHCRSGTRSLTLWTIGEVLAGSLTRDELLDYGARKGFDLTGAVRWLKANEVP